MAKSKYESHVLPNLERIAAWTREGATVGEIAGRLHLGRTSLRRYIEAGERGDERYRALAAALVHTGEAPDSAVETALLKRACGIEYEERTFEQKLDKETGKYEEICTKRVQKYLPPDPTSAIFWLTNRRPEEWKHKPGEKKEAAKEAGGGVVLIPEVKAGEKETAATGCGADAGRKTGGEEHGL